MMANVVVNYKDLLKEAIGSEEVLDGDLLALSRLLGDNVKTPVYQ